MHAKNIIPVCLADSNDKINKLTGTTSIGQTDLRL